MLFLTGLVTAESVTLALSSYPGIPSDEGGCGKVGAPFPVPGGIWDMTSGKISA